MLALQKITLDMFAEAHDAILRQWNPDITEDEWRAAFIPRWSCEEDYIGHALVDGGKIVGILGTIFSRRTLAGRTERLCNLHSWFVRDEYRAKSLMLMRPVVALKNHTITDFTPTKQVIAISKRLGFQTLDRRAVILPPLARGKRPRDGSLVELTSESDAAPLNEVDRLIYEHHRHAECGHALLQVDGGYCYVVYSRVGRRMPYCLVQYMSDRSLFARHHAAIRSHLVRHTGTWYAVVEGRLLAEERIPFSFRVRANEKLYRSTSVGPREIDMLYSEMVFLKRATLPSLKQRLKAVAKSCVPPPLLRYAGVHA